MSLGWRRKTFPFTSLEDKDKVQVKKDRWIEKNQHRYQIEEIFVNNAYGVQFRELHIIE